MEINIKYFGMLAEIIGKAAEKVYFTNAEGIDLISFFKEKYPSIQNINFQVAVNQEINNSIKDIDTVTEIALLPPFAGG